MSEGMMEITAARLGKNLEAAALRVKEACDKIYSEAVDGSERLSAIIQRLGEEDSKVIDYRDAISIKLALEDECIRRWGKAVPYSSMWPAFCQNWRLEKKRSS